MQIYSHEIVTTRTPLRVSLLGGGTDLPDFRARYGGCVISMAIDKYIYVTLRQRTDSEVVIDSPFGHDKELGHALIAQMLERYPVNHGVSIWLSSDVTHRGCGLGTDSALIVGFLKALFYLTGEKDAILIDAVLEIYQTKGNVGTQDIYPAIYSGYNHIRFDAEGVKINNLGAPPFLSKLMLFLTGERDSRDIQSAAKSDDALLEIKSHVNDFLQGTKDIAYYLRKNWAAKRRSSGAVTDKWIDAIYEMGIEAGACAGKLLGAGGGGYMLFYVEEKDQDAVRDKMNAHGLPELKIGLDTVGSTVI